MFSLFCISVICLVHFISILWEAQNLVWEAGCRNHKGGRVGPGSECQRRVHLGRNIHLVCVGFELLASQIIIQWPTCLINGFFQFFCDTDCFITQLFCPKYFLYSLVALEAEHFSIYHILILSRTGLPLLFSKFCDCVIWSFFMWNLEALCWFFKFKFCWSANQNGA